MGKILIDTAETPFSINQLYEIMPYATVFSDNMTNGDVIKAIFPDAEMHEFESLNAVNVVTDKSLNAQTFELDWWNSPYKEENKGND